MPQLPKSLLIHALFLMLVFFVTSAKAGWFDSSFDPSDTPEPPDYSSLSSWYTPPNLDLTNPEADVFYLHPTTFLTEWAWNQDINDRRVNKRTENTYLLWQTVPFTDFAKIYAPIFRQATIYAFIPEKDGGPKDSDSQQAKDVAYEDVEKAFDYYMNNLNKGRPFYLVSHSQGSYLAVRLLQKKYKQYNLGKNMVAAYVVGEYIGDKTFKDMPLCRTQEQTGCFVTWATVQEGKKPQLVTGDPVGPLVCVNPLTFTTSKEAADATANLGGVPMSMDRIDPGIVSAKCENGILRIPPPKKSGYKNDHGDYHESDFNLFAINIGDNALKKLASFKKINNKA